MVYICQCFGGTFCLPFRVESLHYLDNGGGRKPPKNLRKLLKTTRRHIPEDGNRRKSVYFCENFAAIKVAFRFQNRMSENVLRPDSLSGILLKVPTPQQIREACVCFPLSVTFPATSLALVHLVSSITNATYRHWIRFSSSLSSPLFYCFQLFRIQPSPPLPT